MQRSSWSRTGFHDLLVHYKESNLGHVWASTKPNTDCPVVLDPKCPLGHYTFDATTVVLDFFSKWTL